MPEPLLTLICGVSAIVSNAWKISKDLYELIDGIKNAPTHISAISGDLQGLYMVLGVLQGLLPSLDVNQLHRGLIPIFESLHLNMDNCFATLIETFKKLIRYTTVTGEVKMSKWVAFRWQFKEKDIGLLRGHLAAYKMTVNLALATANLANTLWSYERIGNEMQKMHLHLDRMNLEQADSDAGNDGARESQATDHSYALRQFLITAESVFSGSPASSPRLLPIRRKTPPPPLPNLSFEPTHEVKKVEEAYLSSYTQLDSEEPGEQHAALDGIKESPGLANYSRGRISKRGLGEPRISQRPPHRKGVRIARSWEDGSEIHFKSYRKQSNEDRSVHDILGEANQTPRDQFNSNGSSGLEKTKPILKIKRTSREPLVQAPRTNPPKTMEGFVNPNQHLVQEPTSEILDYTLASLKGPGLYRTDQTLTCETIVRLNHLNTRDRPKRARDRRRSRREANVITYLEGLPPNGDSTLPWSYYDDLTLSKLDENLRRPLVLHDESSPSPSNASSTTEANLSSHGVSDQHDHSLIKGDITMSICHTATNDFQAPVKEHEQEDPSARVVTLKGASNQSQTSLLIKYFESSKDPNVHSRPSVRVKVTPSAATKELVKPYHEDKME